MPNNISVGTKVTGVGKSSSELDRLRDKFDKLQKQGAKGFAIGAGAAITAKGLSVLDSALSSTIDFIGDSVQAASNLQQAMGATDAVFGNSGRVLEKFAETSAESFGLSKRAVLQLGATVGAQLQGMGFSADDAADKTVQLQKRAADLAATFGGPTEDALQAVSALLRGERDPIERYGVSLKQVDINARVAAKGLSTATPELKKQSEAVAALELLFEGTAKAQGQFAREADTLAGAQARANAELEDAQAKFGEKLLPFMKDATVLATDLIEDIGQLADAFSAVTDAIGALADDSADRIGGFEASLRDVFEGLGLWSKQAEETGERVADGAKVATDATMMASELAQHHLREWGGEVETLGDKSKRTASRVDRSLQSIVDAFNDAKDELTEIGSDTADAIYDPIILKGELAATEREIAEQKLIATSKKSTKEQVADAKQRMAELNKRRRELITELTAYGARSQKEITKDLRQLAKDYRTHTGAARAQIFLLIVALARLQEAQARARIGTGKASRSGQLEVDYRASGGPVEAFRPYIVGEQGKEMFVPRQDGTIINASETSRIMQGGSSGGSYGGGPMGLTLNVTVNAGIGTTPGAAREIGEAVGPAIYEWGVRRGVWG
jgi:hypothetical protein